MINKKIAKIINIKVIGIKKLLIKNILNLYFNN